MTPEETAAQMWTRISDPDYSLFESFNDDTSRVAAVLACLVGLERMIAAEDLAALVSQVWSEADPAKGLSRLRMATVVRYRRSGNLTYIELSSNISIHNIRRRFKRVEQGAYRRLHETLLVWATGLAGACRPSTLERFNHELAQMIYLLRLGQIKAYEELGLKLMIGYPHGATEARRVGLLRALIAEAD